MLLLKFFQTIDNSFIGRFIERKLELIGNTEPERIYVENIRSFYGITTPVAHFFCEMAVKENLFEKMHGVECPNCNRIIDSARFETSFPEIIYCETCQLLERDRYEFRKSECVVTPFYRLISDKS